MLNKHLKITLTILHKLLALILVTVFSLLPVTEVMAAPKNVSKTLHALWSLDTYTITYNYGGVA